MTAKFLILTATIFISFLSLGQYKKVNSSEINQSDKNITIAQISSETIAQKLAQDYLNKIPTNQIEQKLTLKEAQNIQTQLLKILSPKLGKIVGYKAGLTNQATQEKFGVNHPLSGILLEKMLLNNGAIIPSNFGTRTMLEGDLIVRVKSEGINQAKTPEETLEYLDAVIPFIELPDIVYSENVKPTASELVAINVGARLGVMGETIAINSSQEWHKKLMNIDILIKDENNQELASGNSRNLLGNPLNVVFWLKNSLNEQGIMLKKGDLLSLGTITPMIPIKPNSTIKAEYLGLSQNSLEVNITFK